MSIKIDDEEYYTVQELKEILDMSDVTIRNYLNMPGSFGLKGYQVGRRWYVSKTNLKNWFERERQRLTGDELDKLNSLNQKNIN
jgi:DeoR/GlpR family transcriptional regulator of sugar metabolism